MKDKKVSQIIPDRASYQATTKYREHLGRSKSNLLRRYHPALFQISRTWRFTSKKRRSHIIANLAAVIVLLVTSFPTLPTAFAQPFNALPTSANALPAGPNSTATPLSPTATPTDPVGTSTATIPSASSTPSSPTSSPTFIPPSVTPPPITTTIGPATPEPTVTVIPDTNYQQQASDAKREALLAEVAQLPIATSVSTTIPTGASKATGKSTGNDLTNSEGVEVTNSTGGQVSSNDGGLTLGFRPNSVTDATEYLVYIDKPAFDNGDPRATKAGVPLTYTYELNATTRYHGHQD